VDSFLLGPLTFIQKYLLENLDFTAPPEYKGEVMVDRGVLITIRDPLVINGEPTVTSEEIEWLVKQSLAPQWE
jgi:hypothetical protein